jgi:hypothetical protein
LPSDCSWKCRFSHPEDKDQSPEAPCASNAHAAAAVAWDAPQFAPRCLGFNTRR